MTNTNQTEQPNKFNLHLAIAKVVAVLILIIFVGHGAKAMFTDITHENLEKDFKDAQSAYQKADNDSQLKLEQYQLALTEKSKRADTYCDKWKTLKGYKDSKGIKLKDSTTNVCVQVKASQEGF